MLRFGAARGDVVSVLALPEDDEADDARRHSTRLRTPGAVLESEEEKTLSYGALYHPWLLGPEVEGAGVRSTPPDGAACGTIARRTLRDGAWAAPANERVPAVRTVVPPLEKSQQARLADHNVNVFGEEPGGVLTLGASTLARNSDFEPISTRRLLILIRRLTLREGPELVFENNTPLLRRRIAEQFDALLGGLFKRGAFAGATPEEGYRVRTGPSVNPPGQVERGRLVIELRVAPARPMKFLTVRLVQRGNQSPSVVETGAI
jgi:phage tail sheath protein FI